MDIVDDGYVHIKLWVQETDSWGSKHPLILNEHMVCQYAICHDLYKPSTSIELIVYVMIYVIESTFSSTSCKKEVDKKLQNMHTTYLSLGYLHELKISQQFHSHICYY